MSIQNDHTSNTLPPSAEDSDPLPGTLISTVIRTLVKWMWWGRLAIGKITMLDGDPGVGKSTFYAYVAAAVTLQRSWPEGDYCEEPGAVVVVTAEDALADTIRPRLEASGADRTQVRVLDVGRHAHTDTAGDVLHEWRVVQDQLLAHVGGGGSGGGGTWPYTSAAAGVRGSGGAV